MDGRDDFYVGYFDKAPEALGRRLRAIVIALALAVVAAAGIVASVQRDFPTGVFEFGVNRTFEGVLYETPLPTLRSTHAAGDTGRPAVANFLLSGFGKSGIPAEAQGLDGRKIRFEGSLIYRENMTMVEMNDPSSIEDLGDPSPAEGRGPFEVIGPVTLIGELVDTKCYLGVMKPATGKVHRACAVRCLSGGVPPGLLVRDSVDNGEFFALIGDDGAPLEIDPQLAARTLRVQGKLEVHDGLPVIKARRWTLSGGDE
jgi:hypothetical protein